MKLWVATPQRLPTYSNRGPRFLKNYLKYSCIYAQFFPVSNIQYRCFGIYSSSRRTISRIWCSNILYVEAVKLFRLLLATLYEYMDVQQCSELHFSLTIRDYGKGGGRAVTKFEGLRFKIYVPSFCGYGLIPCLATGWCVCLLT